MRKEGKTFTIPFAKRIKKVYKAKSSIIPFAKIARMTKEAKPKLKLIPS